MLNLVLALTIATLPAPQIDKGTAVSYPWLFANGNDTSRTMTNTVADEVLTRAGYNPISQESAASIWKTSGQPAPNPGMWPSVDSLTSFGRAANAKRILYGKISWRTRSIWVNAGPKTISTATVRVFVFDVSKGRVVYSRNNVKARSDERSNDTKIAAAILFTPLVTAVSGGPATPQEQRAVQLALALAYKDWVQSSNR